MALERGEIRGMDGGEMLQGGGSGVSEASMSGFGNLADAVNQAVSAVTNLASEMERVSGSIREAGAGVLAASAGDAGGRGEETGAGRALDAGGNAESEAGGAGGPERAGAVASPGAGRSAGEEDGAYTANSWATVSSHTLETHRDDVVQVAAAYEGLEKACRSMAGNAAKAIADFATGSKRSVSDLVESILRDLLRLTLFRSVTQPLADWLGGLAGTGGIGSSGMSVGIASSSADLAGGQSLGTSLRTPGASDGPAFRSGYVESPQGRSGTEEGAAGGAVAGGGGAQSPPVNISIHLENQASVPLMAEQRGISRDGHDLVVGVVLRDIEEMGPLWNAIRGKRR